MNPFKMSRSYILMEKLDGHILSNKKEILFGGENEEIQIDKESRELLCVGNSSKSNVKMQITTKNQCDKYTIHTEPKIVNLMSGYACEFEIFLTPLCTMNLNDEVVIIFLDLNNSIEQTTHVKISAQVEKSTKLDYDEIKEDKKLGEGSFGIVFKGSYRGNVVAIKKMKQSNDTDKLIKEFEGEVCMIIVWPFKLFIYIRLKTIYIRHFVLKKFVISKQRPQFWEINCCLNYYLFSDYLCFHLNLLLNF
ncbi:hypothetical protein EIN_448650 [Entamoeba invadens IP1]|uniref:Protein kinase domain-containing protein n=1 Tax=Entamoeba invadens IP1 TaxID=370355 RepID=L7FMK6_ENTIV|nr:hypothetical protein EIN_448650 [Entamoeba invadens IP1]ELP89094.1 hypothetical protein EIN_448650 [Entamoeba invadens IP1]|eukprot:XP_004255865.1 hypothetical protein EIN_448650 [Entamoeba invadens IP1]